MEGGGGGVSDRILRHIVFTFAQRGMLRRPQTNCGKCIWAHEGRFIFVIKEYVYCGQDDVDTYPGTVQTRVSREGFQAGFDLLDLASEKKVVDDVSSSRIRLSHFCSRFPSADWRNIHEQELKTGRTWTARLTFC